MKNYTSELKALTCAALALPGMLPENASADDSNASHFQYSHFQQSDWNLGDSENSMNPLTVETFHSRHQMELTEDLQMSFDYTEDIWSGATPVSSAPQSGNPEPNRPILVNTPSGTAFSGASPMLNGSVTLDKTLTPQNQAPVHILASASPEIRRQVNFKLRYGKDSQHGYLNAGQSTEDDYQSRFGGFGGQWSFNQQLTTVKAAFNYSRSEISATLDHDASPYINKVDFMSHISRRAGSEILRDNRQDWELRAGLSQVLSKRSLFDVSFSYTHSRGYLENPYKAVSVIFIDPNDLGNSTINGDRRALMEQHPEQRKLWDFGIKYIHYIDPFDAALHVNYHFTHDNWNINSHTLELNWVQPLFNGWTLTPRVRYYTQNAANFYTPYLISPQNYRSIAQDSYGREIWQDTQGMEYFRNNDDQFIDSQGSPINHPPTGLSPKLQSFDRTLLPKHYSSNHRLDGFGAISTGFTLSKTFNLGISLELGVDYYRRAANLQMGANNGGDFSDYSYFMVNGGLNVDLETLSLPAPTPRIEHTHHLSAHQQKKHHHSFPAGLMFAHMTSEHQPFMVSYRYRQTEQSHHILKGKHSVGDKEIVNSGCERIKCQYVPKNMRMYMHMLNMMYAPTNEFNLMIMPQFMTMEMSLRELEGQPNSVFDGQFEGHQHHGHGHASGGLGDTIVAGLVKLYDSHTSRWHMGLGVSIPTGDVDQTFRRQAQQNGGLVHYGMQLGSGTWDLLPSLTYSGNSRAWSWGAQIAATIRMQDKNQSGYRLGNTFRSNLWTGYQLSPGLQFSVRGRYLRQQAIKGQFKTENAQIGSMDFPSNYGGHFFDVGFGITLNSVKGAFKGNSLQLEWLQPVQEKMNGYQLERQGELFFSWGYHF